MLANSDDAGAVGGQVLCLGPELPIGAREEKFLRKELVECNDVSGQLRVAQRRLERDDLGNRETAVRSRTQEEMVQTLFFLKGRAAALRCPPSLRASQSSRSEATPKISCRDVGLPTWKRARCPLHCGTSAAQGRHGFSRPPRLAGTVLVQSTVVSSTTPSNPRVAA